MLDQCHNIEPKIPAMIRSVLNVQEATAKALLVDRDALAAAQDGGDVLGANAVLMDAYNTDVRPLLARTARGDGPRPRPDRRLPPRPATSERIVARAGRRLAGRLGRLTVARTPPSAAVVKKTGKATMSRPTRPSPRCSIARTGSAPTRRNTNYAGGNTSAKGTATDPVTGERRRADVGEGVRR